MICPRASRLWCVQSECDEQCSPQTLTGHSAPIYALDFDEPYGVLVTASQDDIVLVHDLCSGEPLGQLRGHVGPVKAVQVEDSLAITGGTDGSVRLWDLRKVEDYEDRLDRAHEASGRKDPLRRIDEEETAQLDSVMEKESDGYEWEEGPSGHIEASVLDDNGPCVRVLEGHSKGVTALYYEDGCLVRKRLRSLS